MAVAAAALAISLAVLGSWVRVNGAGMTCPDWPLCHGVLVPSLHGGVVLEWTHRLIAFVEGFVLLALLFVGLRVRRQVAGLPFGLTALAVVFALQVVLGGLTVHLSNSPISVVAHWATAMVLIFTLIGLALLGLDRERPSFSTRRDAALPALSATACLAFLAMSLGSYVSSSGAGLACPSFPHCGSTFFGADPAQVAQMLHRLAAGAVAVAAFIALLATPSSSARTRRLTIGGAALVALQIGLGALNVVWRLPLEMREAHAANAVFTFVCFALATLAASRDGATVATRRHANDHEPTLRPAGQTVGSP